MRKGIALILILALVFTLGCGKPAEDVTGPEEEMAAEPATTSEAVLDVESELDDIDSLDEDFLAAELDELDAELDFEI